MDSKNVSAVSAGKTYDLIINNYIHAHPVKSPYPKEAKKYLIPIKSGGTMEFLYTVETAIECSPGDVYKYQDLLPEKQYNNLVNYYERRVNDYGFRPDFNYRFYILKKVADIMQPFEKKNVPVSASYNLSEIPLVGEFDKIPRVLFCNITYMKHYKGVTNEDTPVNGGKYVNKTGDALEANNFNPCNDGYIRGYVETKYIDGFEKAEKPKQIHIEKIDSKYKDKDSIENVTVIFCATPKNGGRVVVGWYENATVYRGREKYNDKQFK